MIRSVSSDHGKHYKLNRFLFWLIIVDVLFTLDECARSCSIVRKMSR